MSKVLKVEGMNCANCVLRVRKALEGLKEVRSAVVNLEDETASVELISDVDDSTLTEAVKDVGYSATVVE
jgi:copper chaperone CopZ